MMGKACVMAFFYISNVNAAKIECNCFMRRSYVHYARAYLFFRPYLFLFLFSFLLSFLLSFFRFHFQKVLVFRPSDSLKMHHVTFVSNDCCSRTSINLIAHENHASNFKCTFMRLIKRNCAFTAKSLR